jgi:uncharacterized protein (TIGR03437 family)
VDRHQSQILRCLRGPGARTAAWLLAASSLLAQPAGYTITTVVGGGSSTANGVPATSAFLRAPLGLAFDTDGNLYVVESATATVRKVSSGGIISTVAGGGTLSGSLGDGGPAINVALDFPWDVAVNGAGDLYISEANGYRIRKVTAAGIITTFAGIGVTSGPLGDGGPAAAASLLGPSGLVLDPVGNLYIADTGHQSIRKVSLDGTITTVAGNGLMVGPTGDGGLATEAVLSSPTGIGIDAAGNLYIADAGDFRIRKVSPLGIITTVAGNGSPGYSGDGGPATLASIGTAATGGAVPINLMTDGLGNIYIADPDNNRVRMVGIDGRINTIAGNGAVTGSGDNGPAIDAGLPGPEGLTFGKAGLIYVSAGGAVRLLTPSAKPVTLLPSIEAGGVFTASAFGLFTQAAPGSWIEIYGSYLSSDSRPWASTDFSGINAPISLGGTTVSIGGQPAFIAYVSPGQINAQVPTGIGTGPVPLTVTTSAGTSAPYSVTINSVEPGLLAPASFTISSTPYVVGLFSDGATYVLPAGAISGVPSRPAKAGETIMLYGVGFGAVTPSFPAGEVVQSGNMLVPPFHVFFGSTEATVTYAGLAPGLVGLYQFNVVVPALASTGPVHLAFTLNGVPGTQNLFVSVQ